MMARKEMAKHNQEMLTQQKERILSLLEQVEEVAKLKQVEELLLSFETHNFRLVLKVSDQMKTFYHRGVVVLYREEDDNLLVLGNSFKWNWDKPWRHAVCALSKSLRK